MSTKSTYHEQLLDPRWQRKRLKILERDQFRCQFCGDEDSTLHVHHVHYAVKGTAPWDYRDSSLLSMCEGCHKFEEESLPQARTDIIANIVGAGFNRTPFLVHLADAFSTDAPLTEGDMYLLADVIAKWMDARGIRRPMV